MYMHKKSFEIKRKFLSLANSFYSKGRMILIDDVNFEEIERFISACRDKFFANLKTFLEVCVFML